MPIMAVEISLSDQQLAYERNAYTLFALLGDVGGFNAAILIFPGYIMSFYSARMYQSSVNSDMPTRKRARKQSNRR